MEKLQFFDQVSVYNEWYFALKVPFLHLINFVSKAYEVVSKLNYIVGDALSNLHLINSVSKSY